MEESSILFNNDDNSVFVIDIPTSIAEAQKLESSAPRPRLLSCEPISQPFSSTEPKSKTAEGKIWNHQGDSELHFEVLRTLDAALSAAKEALGPKASYCSDRYVGSDQPWQSRRDDSVRAQKRRRISDQDVTEGLSCNSKTREPTADDLAETLQHLAGDEHESWEQRVYPSSHFTHPRTMLEREQAQEHDSEDAEPSEDWDQHYFNDTNTSCTLEIQSKFASLPGFTFHVPPRSAFILSRCEVPSLLHSVARQFASKGRFDFILLDPPWPNRSASRKSSYRTNSDLRSLEELLVGLDLDMHIATGGYIAVWITNRPAVRELVLGASGLFKVWNISLVEEWAWMKVTQQGEPVTPINGTWRKPYEILLIGKAPLDRMLVAEPMDTVTRRTVLAVPDLHSRKPCLKQIFERILLQGREDYRGLEVFARHLVSGWLSWGDEVLKYNWSGFWS
ncbi:MAG: hypothetical protein M1828_000642 [Chrysothrix sp. TS-e1954]|nr:MAG: hypothetical protein M1828_000642 [Chrysothrix sp. TS-e1954]